MSIVNTNTGFVNSANSPLALTITLNKGSGNNRAVSVQMALFDSNPAAHSVVFDPTGINKTMNVALAQIKHSTQNILVATWYLLDVDLPAISGTYTVDLDWTLVDDSVLMQIVYHENVLQSAPISGSAEANATTAPSIVTGAVATDDVIDIWTTTDAGANVYTPGVSQTQITQTTTGHGIAIGSYGTGKDPMSWTVGAAYDHLGAYIRFATAASGIFNGQAVRDNTSAVSFSSAIVAGPFHLSDTLVNKSDVTQSNLTNLHWASFDADPATGVAPTDYGTTLTDNGSGYYSVPIPNSTKLSGQQVWLMISNAAGTKFFFNKVTVRNYYEV